MRFYGIRTFLAGVGLSIVDALLDGPPAPTGVVILPAEEVPLDSPTAAPPCAPEGAPLAPPVVPHEGQACPACIFAIDTIATAYAGNGYDAAALPHALRSLCLLGHGLLIDPCPFHVRHERTAP